MHWNEVERNRVMGAYFCIHWMTQIPGGILAKRYGTKLVFGLSNFVVCAICFIIPIAAYWDIKALIVLRMIQGFVSVGFLIYLFILSRIIQETDYCFASLHAGCTMAIDASFGSTLDSTK